MFSSVLTKLEELTRQVNIFHKIIPVIREFESILPQLKELSIKTPN